MTECPVCCSTAVSSAGVVEGFPTSSCAECTHWFVSKTPADSDLDAAYSEDYYTNKIADGHGYQDYLVKTDQRMSGFKSRLDNIERYAPSRGRILDYGCAIGLFVKVAASQGWDAKGYERSSWAVEYGRNVLKLDIELGHGGWDPYPAESFDVVTLWDVMEHVDAPRNVMSLVSKWLKPGGLLALNTLNSSSLGARLAGRHWRHLLPPHHLQFFTKRSLLALLESHGFMVCSVQASGTFMARTDDLKLESGIKKVVDDLVGHWRVRPLVSRLNMLDELEMVAVKRR